MPRKETPGTLEDLPHNDVYSGYFHGNYQTSRGNRDWLWTEIVEAMYQHRLDMPTVIAERKAVALAEIVNHRLQRRGLAVNPKYSTLLDSRPEMYELNLDGTRKYSQQEREIPGGATREGSYEPVKDLVAAVGDLAMAYPNLDPFNPSTIPTFLHPNFNIEPEPLTGFVSPPSFRGQDLPAHEKALVPVTWAFASFAALPSTGKVIVSTLVAVFILGFILNVVM